MPKRAATCSLASPACARPSPAKRASSFRRSPSATISSSKPTTIASSSAASRSLAVSCMPGRWLAMNVSGSKVRLKGVPTREPVFNLDATWIDEAEKKTARNQRLHRGRSRVGSHHAPFRNAEVERPPPARPPGSPVARRSSQTDAARARRGVAARPRHARHHPARPAEPAPGEHRDRQPAVDSRGHRRLRLAVEESRRSERTGPPPPWALLCPGVRDPPGYRSRRHARSTSRAVARHQGPALRRPTSASRSILPPPAICSTSSTDAPRAHHAGPARRWSLYRPRYVCRSSASSSRPSRASRCSRSRSCLPPRKSRTPESSRCPLISPAPKFR